MDDQNNSNKHLEAAGDKIKSAIDNIFKLSTGALALSITFRNSLTNSSQYLWLLSIAWILLGIVPISYVFLRLTEAQIDLFWCQKYKKAEDAFSEGKEESLLKELPPEFKIKSLVARFWYYSLFTGFVLGVAAFLLFAILNNVNEPGIVFHRR